MWLILGYVQYSFKAMSNPHATLHSNLKDSILYKSSSNSFNASASQVVNHSRRNSLVGVEYNPPVARVAVWLLDLNKLMELSRRMPD